MSATPEREQTIAHSLSSLFLSLPLSPSLPPFLRILIPISRSSQSQKMKFPSELSVSSCRRHSYNDSTWQDSELALHLHEWCWLDRRGRCSISRRRKRSRGKVAVNFDPSSDVAGNGRGGSVSEDVVTTPTSSLGSKVVGGDGEGVPLNFVVGQGSDTPQL